MSGQHVGKNIAWGGHHCHGKTPASLDVFKNSWVLQSSENKRERAVLIQFNVTKFQILSNSKNPVDVCQNRIDWRCFLPGRIVVVVGDIIIGFGGHVATSQFPEMQTAFWYRIEYVDWTLSMNATYYIIIVYDANADSNNDNDQDRTGNDLMAKFVHDFYRFEIVLSEIAKTLEVMWWMI